MKLAARAGLAFQVGSEFHPLIEAIEDWYKRGEKKGDKWGMLTTGFQDLWESVTVYIVADAWCARNIQKTAWPKQRRIQRPILDRGAKVVDNTASMSLGFSIRLGLFDMVQHSSSPHSSSTRNWVLGKLLF